MYDRTFNFSAGPATMPVPVLEEIRDELLNYRGAGMGVMEMSHRSKVFQQIIDEAEQDLRDLMGIPDNYKVLFIQGGKAARKQRYQARQRCVSRCRAARFARGTGTLLHLTKLRTKIF